MRFHTKKFTPTIRVIARGFTLIELMVSLTVFSIVMVVSIGTLLIMIDSNAKAQALYSSSVNLSFALDSMTRELRTGYKYFCSTATSSPSSPLPTGRADCDSATPGVFIVFTRERDGARMGYQLNGASLEQKIDSGNWNKITSDDVIISAFEMMVTNTATVDGGGNGEQPIIDLKVKGYVNNGLDEDTDFNIQSHIVERRLDLI